MPHPETTSREQAARIAVLCRDDRDRPPGMEQLADRAELTYATADTLPQAIEDADALFVWDFFSPAVRTAWPNATRLQWIHVAAAGVDAILFDDLVRSDVLLTNARGIFDQPIAEYVLAAILARAKQLYCSYDLQRDRQWHHRETQSIAGQHAMVVGTGGIGRATARLLRAVGMRVTGAGRRARDDDPDFGIVIESGRLAEHLDDVDHVVLAAPLTPDTRGMINSSVLASVKSGSHLINIGRGQLVDDDALLKSLRSGRLAAATLDVFSTEPLPDDHPFWAEPGVVISPHLSGDTVGWHERLAAQFIELAHRWLAGRELINIVDKQRGYSASAGRSSS